jgi:hypothetical protein
MWKHWVVVFYWGITYIYLILYLVAIYELLRVDQGCWVRWGSGKSPQKFTQGRIWKKSCKYLVKEEILERSAPPPRLPLPAFLGVFQQEINLINSDTITAILQSSKCYPVPIRQHDVMMQFWKCAWNSIIIHYTSNSTVLYSECPRDLKVLHAKSLNWKKIFQDWKVLEN